MERADQGAGNELSNPSRHLNPEIRAFEPGQISQAPESVGQAVGALQSAQDTLKRLRWRRRGFSLALGTLNLMNSVLRPIEMEDTHWLLQSALLATPAFAIGAWLMALVIPHLLWQLLFGAMTYLVAALGLSIWLRRVAMLGLRGAIAEMRNNLSHLVTQSKKLQSSLADLRVKCQQATSQTTPRDRGCQLDLSVGVTGPICPYCRHQLDKMPGRKTQCPSCRNDIFVRTRPQDKVRILVRGDQLLAVEEQWAIANGTHHQFLAAQQRRQNISAQLRSRFGREPSENDIDWALLNDDILKCVKDRNWGLYRNARFAMAEILSKEKKDSQALDFLLEVCYLDLNGPNNCGGISDPQLLRDFPPFDPTAGSLAPGVVGRIHHTMQILRQSSNQIESRFLAVANRLAQSLKLPLLPDKAWPKLEREMKAIQ